MIMWEKGFPEVRLQSIRQDHQISFQKKILLPEMFAFTAQLVAKHFLEDMQPKDFAFATVELKLLLRVLEITDANT